MKILHKPSETLRDAVIELMENDDWERVYQSDEFGFDWAKERKWTVYKLTLEGDAVIQGLISVEDVPKEYRSHIHLIENKVSNKGKDKVYDYVAGCLIAYVCSVCPNTHNFLLVNKLSRNYASKNNKFVNDFKAL